MNESSQHFFNIIFDELKKKDRIKITFSGAMCSGTRDAIVVARRKYENGCERISLGDPTTGKVFKPGLYLSRRKERVSFTLGDLGCTLEAIERI